MEEHLYAQLRGDDRNDDECRRLARLMVLLSRAGDPPNAATVFPRYGRLKEKFLAAADSAGGYEIEESFLELYAHLHMHEAPYTASERRRMDATGGYWAHAGGLSPILKAVDHIDEETVSADLGAGNGLQGLLLQLLSPHARTVQVEISSRMVEIGRDLQTWLGIPGHRVQWQVGDVLDFELGDVGFLYLYRPLRPEGPGDAFYQRLARQLDEAAGQVIIFSIADCLRHYLVDAFEIFYSDGHLTCFRRRD